MTTFTSRNYPALRIAADGRSHKFAGGRLETSSDADASAVRKFAKAHPEYGISESTEDAASVEATPSAAPADLVEASTGNTVADAKAQDPALDTEAPAASQVPPVDDQQVLAQTPEEVAAQAVNPAGGDEDLDSLTVPELQQLARNRGMKTGGNKADLLERLRGVEEGE